MVHQPFQKPTAAFPGPHLSECRVGYCVLCGVLAFSGGRQSSEDSTSLLMVPVSQSSAGRCMHEPDRDNEFYIPYGQMGSVAYSSSAGGFLQQWQQDRASQ